MMRSSPPEPQLREDTPVRLPTGRFATIVALYRNERGQVDEASVRVEDGQEFRIRVCHLRAMP
jgi:hypothetical protein